LEAALDIDRLPPNRIWINCRCCQLPQVNKDRDGAIPSICDDCFPHHRGERPEMRADRAESHERMLRERLAKCRDGVKASEEKAAAAAERMASALNSRGALAVRLAEAAEANRSGHNCAAMEIANEKHVTELARRHRERGINADIWDRM